MRNQRRPKVKRPRRFDKWHTPMGGYKAYSIAHHRRFLRLDDTFLNSITPRTKILEIGFGSGRLAGFLLKNTKLRPENLQLIDINYNNLNESPLDMEYGSQFLEPQKPKLPYLKRRISQLIARKRLRATMADMHFHEYPHDFFDHVIVSEAIFGFHIDEFLEDIVPAIKKNGSLRMSDVQNIFIPKPNPLPHQWPQQPGMMIEKIKKICRQNLNWLN